MIGRLKGILLTKQPPDLLIDVNGVGYEVEAPMSTFYDLPPAGKEVVLLTHQVIKDDAHSLYGFLRETDRSLFRSLLRISGVGAKLALTILSGCSADEFARMVQEKDAVALTRLPGIGKKTAERLIMEMKDRLGDLGDLGVRLPGTSAAAGTGPAGADGEAQSALIALGYKPVDAARMVKAVANDGDSVEQIVKAALKSKVNP